MNSENHQRPELRSSCCNAPVTVSWNKAEEYDYICDECTNTCALRNTDQEEFER